MKRINKAARAWLVAVVTNTECQSCGTAPVPPGPGVLCTGCWRARFERNEGKERHSGYLRRKWIEQVRR